MCKKWGSRDGVCLGRGGVTGRFVWVFTVCVGGEGGGVHQKADPSTVEGI